MSVVGGNGWKYGQGFSNRDLAMDVLRAAISAIWPTFVGSHENSRRLQPLQKTLGHPRKTQSVPVNSTNRGSRASGLVCVLLWKPSRHQTFQFVADVEKGELMRSTLDLFRRNEDGEFIWLEAGEDLKAAKLRLQELSASAPGEYLLFDRATAQIIERLRKEDVRSR